MSALNRIHFGVMGDAKCHVTDGWFCEDMWRPVICFTLAITRKLRVTLGL